MDVGEVRAGCKNPKPALVDKTERYCPQRRGPDSSARDCSPWQTSLDPWKIRKGLRFGVPLVVLNLSVIGFSHLSGRDSALSATVKTEKRLTRLH